MLSFHVCSGCAVPLPPFAQAACELCLSYLRPAPAICADCLGLGCDPRCLRPALRLGGPTGLTKLDSFGAGFLSVGPAHGILRHWKKSPHARLETGFFGRIEWSRLRALRDRGLDAIVPVPQAYGRSVMLGGGPARRLAHRLSRALGVPVEETIGIQGNTYHRQAGRSGTERYETPIEFTLKRGTAPAPGRVLLVDDLFTSGRTLRAAVRALRLGGSDRVDGWVLGFRPSLHAGFGADRAHDLG